VDSQSSGVWTSNQVECGHPIKWSADSQSSGVRTANRVWTANQGVDMDILAHTPPPHPPTPPPHTYTHTQTSDPYSVACVIYFGRWGAFRCWHLCAPSPSTMLDVFTIPTQAFCFFFLSHGVMVAFIYKKMLPRVKTDLCLGEQCRHFR